MMKRIFILPLSISLSIAFTACGKPSDAEVQQLLEQTKKNLVFVEGGSFMMGDGGTDYIDQNGNKAHTDQWTSHADNKPAHKVTLDSYYIQKYEVTWAEFDIFSKATGLPLREQDIMGKEMRDPKIAAGVGTWQNAKNYCQWLAKESGIAYDLPTEAQWEYAARSRGQSDLPFATNTGWIRNGYNYGASYGSLAAGDPVPVGLHPPNPLGIHDMTGNVTEFVQDWYDPKYYAKSPEKNPQGPTNGEDKVNRGASNAGSPSYNSLYIRRSKPYDYDHVIYAGVRCVINSPKL